MVFLLKKLTVDSSRGRKERGRMCEKESANKYVRGSERGKEREREGVGRV